MSVEVPVYQSYNFDPVEYDWFSFVKWSAEREQEHWNSVGKYGISKISNCMLQSWLIILGKSTQNYKFNFEYKKIFLIGTAVHELLQNAAVDKHKASKEKEVKYYHPTGKYEVLSYIDLIINDKVIDIKTTWSKLENFKTDGPMHQVNFYMGLEKQKEGGIFALSLNDHFKEFTKHDTGFFPHKFNNSMFEADKAKYERLTDCLVNVVPPCEYTETYCKSCQYSMMCPQKVPEEERDTAYKGYWKGFYTELDEAERNRKDAIRDTLPPKFDDASDEVWDLDLSDFDSIFEGLLKRRK